MITCKWLVRLFFWLPICLKQIFGEDNLGPWYMLELCLVSAIGTTPVILTLFGVAFSEDMNYPLLGIGVSFYLLVGAVFFFTHRSSNYNPVWQDNGPW